MDEEKIKAECIRRDEMADHFVHYITSDSLTFRLTTATIAWSSLDHGERFCMVKNGNLFDSKNESIAAIGRALSR
ncbi:hypothetical protein RYA05_03760 [Pseudomonas syringae pv. actinidiae]|nr:hypothetical protein [Pseudomonas syringae pv. actinidiae]